MMNKKVSKTQRVRNYVAENPSANASEVAKALKISAQYVYTIMWKLKKTVVKPPRIKQQIEMLEPKSDPVDHPAHYKVGGIETIDFIEAKSLGYNIGNVVKYLARADYKGNKLEDLRKAQWYLTREINALK